MSSHTHSHDIVVYKGSASGAIVQAITHKEGLKPNEVLIKITHSGVCATDLHIALPNGIVLGHEGVGIVQEIGNTVSTLEVGQRVGFGFVKETCGNCEKCLEGKDVYCEKKREYLFSDYDQGSFASHAIWPESWLFAIPDSIPSEDAAPLMCGGATVFSALSQYSVKSTDRVGIIGIGGLGHLAIQFAAKMGCDVVAFSTTEDKREEAMNLGARHFFATKGETEWKITGKLDHLLICTSVQPDYTQFMPILKPECVIYPLTVSFGNITVPLVPLVTQGITIQGLVTGSRKVLRKTLDFAALHGIRPTIQKFPLDVSGIEESLQTLRDGKMRYRGVLVAAAS